MPTGDGFQTDILRSDFKSGPSMNKTLENMLTRRKAAAWGNGWYVRGKKLAFNTNRLKIEEKYDLLRLIGFCAANTTTVSDDRVSLPHTGGIEDYLSSHLTKKEQGKTGDFSVVQSTYPLRILNKALAYEMKNMAFSYSMGIIEMDRFKEGLIAGMIHKHNSLRHALAGSSSRVTLNPVVALATTNVRWYSLFVAAMTFIDNDLEFNSVVVPSVKKNEKILYSILPTPPIKLLEYSNASVEAMVGKPALDAFEIHVENMSPEYMAEVTMRYNRYTAIRISRQEGILSKKIRKSISDNLNLCGEEIHKYRREIERLRTPVIADYLQRHPLIIIEDLTEKKKALGVLHAELRDARDRYSPRKVEEITPIGPF